MNNRLFNRPVGIKVETRRAKQVDRVQENPCRFDKTWFDLSPLQGDRTGASPARYFRPFGRGLSLRAASLVQRPYAPQLPKASRESSPEQCAASCVSDDEQATSEAGTKVIFKIWTPAKVALSPAKLSTVQGKSF